MTCGAMRSNRTAKSALMAAGQETFRGLAKDGSLWGDGLLRRDIREVYHAVSCLLFTHNICEHHVITGDGAGC
ncbi:hypothetical protein RRF57_009270 [Xylaria bambusicola]|uniref:Uncharacterized protein n=1 Tax=Xylaria bambusicola TaxID=326684 RepID=A0AAN7UV99_9PEZI